MQHLISTLAIFFCYTIAGFCLWAIGSALVVMPVEALLLFPFGLRMGILLQTPPRYWPGIVAGDVALQLFLANQLGMGDWLGATLLGLLSCLVLAWGRGRGYVISKARGRVALAVAAGRGGGSGGTLTGATLVIGVRRHAWASAAAGTLWRLDGGTDLPVDLALPGTTELAAADARNPTPSGEFTPAPYRCLPTVIRIESLATASGATC